MIALPTPGAACGGPSSARSVTSASSGAPPRGTGARVQASSGALPCGVASAHGAAYACSGAASSGAASAHSTASARLPAAYFLEEGAHQPCALRPAPCALRPAPCLVEIASPEVGRWPMTLRSRQKWAGSSRVGGEEVWLRGTRVRVGGRRTLPRACTLHPAPCTLHPAPCTLHLSTYPRCSVQQHRQH